MFVYTVKLGGSLRRLRTAKRKTDHRLNTESMREKGVVKITDVYKYTRNKIGSCEVYMNDINPCMNYQINKC